MSAELSPNDCPEAAGIVCGLDELVFHSGAPTQVLSILDPGQTAPPALASCRPDRLLRLRFHDAIEASPGLKLPTIDDVAAIIDFGSRLDSAVPLIVHCHYGISRSTAAMATLIARNPSVGAREVFIRLLRIRPRAWPNSLMIHHADQLLGRGGMLMLALARLYSFQLRRVPEIAQFMRTHRPCETGMADAVAEKGLPL